MGCASTRVEGVVCVICVLCEARARVKRLDLGRVAADSAQNWARAGDGLRLDARRGSVAQSDSRAAFAQWFGRVADVRAACATATASMELKICEVLEDGAERLCASGERAACGLFSVRCRARDFRLRRDSQPVERCLSLLLA